MDRKMQLNHLAIAEKAVLDGERYIQNEEQMISDLDGAGHDTTLARATLATFRRSQAQHIAHRDLLLEMLQQDASSIVRPGHYDPTPQPEETFRARNCNRHP
jgi:hypothetical protein